MVADKHAGNQYNNPYNIETPWQDERNTRPGQIIIETGIRRYHPVTGRTTKTILKHTRTLATRLALDKELEHITRNADTNINFDFLDMKLQEKIERNDKKKGQLIRHMKLTAGIYNIAVNEKTNGNLGHSDKSREETTDGNGMGRAKDTKSKQSTEDNKATIGDKTEPINNGQKKEQTEKQDNKEPAENSQNGGNEIYRNNGKRKEKQRAGQDTDGRNAKWKLRRKTVQNTITQYMNTNRSGKRKREHTVHRNKRGEDIGERENGQDKEGTKRTRPRQTEITKRKGIG